MFVDQAKTLGTDFHRERSGQFGLHAVCPPSSRHMQVTTAGVWRVPHFRPSSRRRPGSSVLLRIDRANI